jgi:hypothetical protein
MSSELICNWLQLPSGTWPPDHYTLLGLERGESDVALAEQRVHERMEQLRRHQLLYPEPATEAMNRLAQALVCLTDPAAKRAYDESLLTGPYSGTDTKPSHAIPSEGAPADPFAWLLGDPPAHEASYATPAGLPNFPLEGVAPFEALPHVSSRRGQDQSAKQELYKRVLSARRLLRAWDEAGRFLANPILMTDRPARGSELERALPVIRDSVDALFPALAETGHPGSLVAALARQQMITPTLQTFLPDQREALARDWQAGQAILRAGIQQLREELRRLRRRSRWARRLRLARLYLAEQPGGLLVLSALVALNAAEPTLRNWWPQQLVVLVALLVMPVLRGVITSARRHAAST